MRKPVAFALCAVFTLPISLFIEQLLTMNRIVRAKILTPGNVVSEFELTGLDREKVRFNDYQGKGID